MKSILVIGMGNFGYHLVQKLSEFENENEVMIIDRSETRIRDLFAQVFSARVGDCTNVEVLRSLDIPHFDVVIVCINEDFQNSLEVTSLVKELGAKYVISAASRDIQAKFLLKNGADEVVYPERDVANNIATTVSNSHIFDYIKLTDEYSIYEIPIIPQWIGKSIKDVNVRAEYNINIIGIVSDGTTMIMPSADYIFCENDHIKVISERENIRDILQHI